MHRLFKNHHVRKNFYLNYSWDFATDPEREGEKQQWYTTFPKDTSRMFVPGCWNNEMGLYHYENVAWYKTTFHSDSKNLLITFHSVTMFCKVYLDGKLLGEHFGGHTRFRFEVKDLKPGEHTLIVMVDNRHSDALNTIPREHTDWFHYGGLFREVEIAELNDAYIKDYKITYDIEGESIKLKGYAILTNLTKENIKQKLCYDFNNGTKIHDGEVNLAPGDNKIEFDEKTLTGLALWDLENPALYNFSITIDDDDVIDRIGFRKLEARDAKIFLNGKPLKLKGVNRHEDHPDWGFALPQKLMQYDIEILKDLGCNTVRGSHMPYDEAFIDMCDERGILVWSQIPANWIPPDMMEKNPVVRARIMSMLEEMVDRDFHKPSIFVWSLHNECLTYEEGVRGFTVDLVKKVKSMDTSRLISYTTNYPLTDICFDLVDVACMNIYFGWYKNAHKEETGLSDGYDSWPRLLEMVEEKFRKSGWSHMPLMVTEYGGEGIYGDTGFESRKWSEQYQAELLEYITSLLLKTEGITGMYIWQMTDVRTDKASDDTRPRSFNNKGIVNEYRKPKMSYFAIRDLYNAHGNYNE